RKGNRLSFRSTMSTSSVAASRTLRTAWAQGCFSLNIRGARNEADEISHQDDRRRYPVLPRMVGKPSRLVVPDAVMAVLKARNWRAWTSMLPNAFRRGFR